MPGISLGLFWDLFEISETAMERLLRHGIDRQIDDTLYNISIKKK